MNNQDVMDGVLDWCRVEIPALQGGYAYMPSFKTAALPDVVVQILEVRTALEDPLFPMRQLQQRWLLLRTVGISLMVENSDPAAAAEQLSDFADTLTAGIMRDGTLGGRVPFVSPFFAFDFSAPFVEYQDGTRGREMSMNISVGELVEDNS